MVNSQTDYFADLDPFFSEAPAATDVPDSAEQFFSRTYLGVEAEAAQTLSNNADGQGMIQLADASTEEHCVASNDIAPMLNSFDESGAEAVSVVAMDVHERPALQEPSATKMPEETVETMLDVVDTQSVPSGDAPVAVQAAPVVQAQTMRSPEAALAVMPPRASDVAKALNNDDAANETRLRDEKAVQFVGFYIGTQLYAIPTLTIREVIRRTDISRLPVAVEHVPGVISLRGEVLPLVHLRGLLQVETNIEGRANGFNIICMCYGNRLGLQVDRVHSMYMIEQQNIQWNVSAILGLDDDDCVRGLFEMNEKLIPIISVERIATMLHKSGVYTEENK